MHLGDYSTERSASPLEECAESGARAARLLRTIEIEIVPRLVLARRVAKATVAVEAEAARPGTADVAELVRLLLAHDVSGASAYAETVRQRGASFEAVCLDLLAPAARKLGVLWETDECDFMQVTVGLCGLHQLLRELTAAFRVECVESQIERNILLAPVPGDQHTFGITLVAQFLRQAGWQVWCEFTGGPEQLLDLVRTQWFAAVGLSVGSETRIEALTQIVQAVRRASRNPAIGILVGGPLLVARPELAVTAGADATAVDGPAAVRCIESLCAAQDGASRSSATSGSLS